MFDIGFWELLVIGIVALVVLGPERLPGAIRSTLKTVKSIKEVANGFKQEVSHQLKISELHEHIKQAEQAGGLSEVSEDVRKSVEELKAAAASVQQPYAKKSTITHPTNSILDSSDPPEILADKSEPTIGKSDNASGLDKNDKSK